ncbi:MAG: hypothetical protein RL033_662 [Pseudomonadota bacterium]
MLHREAWPVIDYRAHPAFAPHAVAPQAALEQEVEGLVAQANEALRTRYDAGEHLPEAELESWLERELATPFERLRELCAATLPTDQVMSHCLDAALRDASEDARAEARFRNRVAEPRSRRMARTERAVLHELRANSIVVGQLDPQQIRAMATDLEPQMALLRESESAERGTRSWRILPRAGAYYRVLQQALDEHGYTGATSAFHGCEMELLSVNLVYSHERERWWRDCYADQGLPTSPATYFHHDQDWHQIKAVIYLTPATRESGAFSFIEGGHRFRQGNALAHIYFHLTHAMDRAAAAANAGLPHYYRRAFSVAGLRAGFVGLPRILQGATHFGDDLLEGSPQTAALLARERIVESGTGNIVLFNGGDLLHRGGLVQRGERWSLQLMFGPRVTPAQRLLARAQHTALVAAGRALGWRRLDQLRSRRRSQRGTM